MSERSPKPYPTEQPEALSITAYSERLKEFTDKVLPRNGATGEPKAFVIPVNADDVQEELEKNLGRMLIDPEDELDSFKGAESTESTEVKLYMTKSASERDIVP